jgi:hypothetical protein
MIWAICFTQRARRFLRAQLFSYPLSSSKWIDEFKWLRRPLDNLRALCVKQNWREPSREIEREKPAPQRFKDTNDTQARCEIVSFVALADMARPSDFRQYRH